MDGMRVWEAGEAAPSFTARASNNPAYRFDSVAGRYVVLCFYGSAGHAERAQAMAFLASMRGFFNDQTAALFGISTDKSDEAEARVEQQLPGVRYFWDFDTAVSRLYGAVDDRSVHHAFTLILDPMLRVLAQIPLLPPARHHDQVEALLRQLPPPALHAGLATRAPALVVPRVFEPEFCRELIGLYETHGGKESGFMKEIDGKTVPMMSGNMKRRKDFNFGDTPEFETLRMEVERRIARRLLPEIYRAFQFKVTRIERFIVACYESESQGFFKAHRDNTTKGTAHRRFACTLNLNTEEYEGGELRFPEFGPDAFRAPTGGAVVFSCSLMHEAMPVTKGVRYAFLPFFYDEAGADIRKANAEHITDRVINRDRGDAETL